MTVVCIAVHEFFNNNDSSQNTSFTAPNVAVSLDRGGSAGQPSDSHPMYPPGSDGLDYTVLHHSGQESAYNKANHIKKEKIKISPSTTFFIFFLFILRFKDKNCCK